MYQESFWLWCVGSAERTRQRLVGICGKGKIYVIDNAEFMRPADVVVESV